MIFYLQLLLFGSMTLDAVFSQHSNFGFSYDRIPSRPRVPERIRPVQVMRPDKPRPVRPLPSEGGSRYLRKKPGKKNLDKLYLLELMGDDYNTTWMSYEKPANLTQKVPAHEVGNVGAVWDQESWLMDHIQELNITAELSSMEPELLPLQRHIKSWLIKRSSCPVFFTWKDLGRTFWPRWVREGQCLDRKGACSFPTGMNCVPVEKTDVYIMRWVCRERKMTIVQKSAEKTRTVRSPDGPMHWRRVAEFNPDQRRRRKRCEWEKVEFPITIGCFCLC